MSPPKKSAAKKAAPKKSAPEADPALAEAAAAATPAEADLEEMIAEYDALMAARREPLEAKSRREALKSEIVARLSQDGPRLYLTPDGVKRVAWQTTPENVTLDVEELIRMDEEGLVPFDLLDRVAPRQLSREGLRSAIATGALTPEQVRTLVTLVPGTPRVYSHALEGDEDEPGE